MSNEPATSQKVATIYAITDTTYYDGSLWVEYLVDGQSGYEITYKDYEDNDPAALNEWAMEHLTDKPHISCCSEYLGSLIEKTRQSDNEMWFVEYEHIDPNQVDQLVDDLEKEIKALGIEDYVTFHQDETLITIYGGILTKFLF